LNREWLHRVGHSDLRPGRFGRTDVIVLDLGADGIDACAGLRAAGTTAGILVVLPTDEVELRVRALDAGADDCLPSPADGNELIARAETIRRRNARRSGEPLRAFDVELDVRGSRAWRAGRALELTNVETRLLEVFVRNPRQVLPRQLIIERVWGDAARENVLEVYVGYLRRKLESANEPRLIQTVRGVGYALSDDPAFRSRAAGRSVRRQPESVAGGCRRTGTSR